MTTASPSTSVVNGKTVDHGASAKEKTNGVVNKESVKGKTKEKSADAKDDQLTAKDYYFDSYSHFGIHEEMLKDRVRTETYRNAIVNNKHLFKDKVVLDIGCGTGILCLFAAQAGAKKVIGVECASIAKHARQIVADNGFKDVIEIVRGKVEEIELPGVDKVDIIVSEWMGYFMLYESMLDTVLFARDKWLKEGGILMPDKGTLYFGCLEDQAYKQEKVHFWDKVYGFDMSCIKDDVFNEPLVDCVEQQNICSHYMPVLEIDLYTVKKEDLNFKAKAELPVIRNDYVHALVSFFTVEFTKCHKLTGFGTGPQNPYTHWKQTVFYVTDDLMVTKGSSVGMDIDVKRNKKNPRDLDIRLKVSYMGKTQERLYMMR